MPLEARQLSFRYDRHAPWLLDDVTLSLARGERLALLAPSGYGKTTLALLLAGYLTPQRGEVLCDGAPLPKRGVSPVQLIFQHPEKAINPRWKLRRVLAESGNISPALLDALGIAPSWLDRYPRELSGGELQRFCVARALATNAPYLICDEISTMLDVITQAQLWHLLIQESEQKNLGLLAITHNPHLAKRIATRTLHLDAH